MHRIFPLLPFFSDNRPHTALGGMRLFLTLAEELEFQDSRRRELEQSEDERKLNSAPPSLERQK